MDNLVKFSQRYVAPFLTGACFAGATVAETAPLAAALVLVGGVMAVISFPAASRMIRRLSGTAS